MKNKLLITGILIYSLLSGNLTAYAATGGFTVYPSRTHDGNKSWIITRAEPGKTAEESITLENLSDDIRQISIEVKEAKNENGKFTPVDGPLENIGNWISVPQTSYLLEPRQKVTIPVSITVPAGIPNDNYNAAIFAVQKEKNANGLNIVTQIGVRVYLDVSGNGAGFISVFNSPAYKGSFFFILSLMGVSASLIYFLINFNETKKYGKRQA